MRAANVLIGESGDVLISDFGLARLEEVAEAQTLTSQNTTGAARWMAPGIGFSLSLHQISCLRFPPV